ncbi:MAG: hypothetical protein ABIJ34_01245 [archaeon]
MALPKDEHLHYLVLDGIQTLEHLARSPEVKSIIDFDAHNIEPGQISFHYFDGTAQTDYAPISYRVFFNPTIGMEKAGTLISLIREDGPHWIFSEGKTCNRGHHMPFMIGMTKFGDFTSFVKFDDDAAEFQAGMAMRYIQSNIDTSSVVKGMSMSEREYDGISYRDAAIILRDSRVSEILEVRPMEIIAHFLVNEFDWNKSQTLYEVIDGKDGLDFTISEHFQVKNPTEVNLALQAFASFLVNHYIRDHFGIVTTYSMQETKHMPEYYKPENYMFRFEGGKLYLTLVDNEAFVYSALKR